MSNAKKAEAPVTKDASKDDVNAAGKGKFANKKHIIIFAFLGVLFLGLMIGGTLFLIKSLSEEDPEAAFAAKENSSASANQGESGAKEGKNDEKLRKGDSEGKSAATYMIMKPAFVVNFNEADGQHFLQVDVTLMSHDSDAVEAVNIHMPLLRNALVMLFGGQSISALETTEGKETLRQQSLVEMQKILKKEIGKNGIEDLYFTSMVMQ